MPPGISLLVYPDPKRLPAGVVVEDGLRLIPLAEALTRVSDAWFREQPESAEIALRLVANAGWHQALFQPHADAGLVSPADLLGDRRIPVYIRGARHIPPPGHAVPDACEALFTCLRAEPHPAVRAVLGHLPPHLDPPLRRRNGRVARSS